MKLKYILLALLIAILNSCSNDDLYLEESIFIEDPEVPELPIYSELGYNTFGVRCDRETITNNDYDYPLTVVVEDGKTYFVFKGEKNNYTEYDFSIVLNDFLPSDEYDLLNLDDTSINLDGDNVELIIKESGDLKSVEVLSGEFKFSKAQYLLVDEVNKGVILSGVFEFKALVDGEPSAFSYGRFDVIVGYSNFFVLN